MQPKSYLERFSALFSVHVSLLNLPWGVEMTHFGEYFKLLERLDPSLASAEESTKDLDARLRELGYIVRRDERLEPWQRTVLLEQLFLLQRPAKPKQVCNA